MVIWIEILEAVEKEIVKEEVNLSQIHFNWSFSEAVVTPFLLDTFRRSLFN